MKLETCYNIVDLERLAAKKLPKAVHGYLTGYAEDGITGRRNREAFNQVQLLPKALVDVADADTSCTLFGTEYSAPMILAPTAMSRLFHYQGERAVASAAGAANLPYALSTLSTVSIEEISQIEGNRWFQVYMYKDKSLSRECIERAQQAGYTALCVTVDVAVHGNREHDMRNGFRVPPKITLGNALEALEHLGWVWRYLTTEPIIPVNIDPQRLPGKADTASFLAYIDNQLSASVTWDDIDWIRSIWDGPLMIKGLLHPEDVKTALQHGVQAVVLSNHGGRQLDHAPSSFEMIPAIMDTVQGDLEVILDGGIRRGSDVVKAMALGASACMIGRPYLFGLSAGGETGVCKALDLLKSEIRRVLQLLGCPTLKQLDTSYIRINGTNF